MGISMSTRATRLDFSLTWSLKLGMKRTPVLALLLIGLIVSGDPAHAKCISTLARVQGDLRGQLQQGASCLVNGHLGKGG
jgi:hypothetical protein